MSIIRYIMAVTVICLGYLETAFTAENPVPLEIGATLPDFSLPGIDGKTYSQKDFSDAPVLVIIFTCNHCPTAQAYEDRIKKLHEEYKTRGVALVAVTPNDPAALRPDEQGYSELGDSLEDTKIRAKERGFTFPYLYDGDTQKFSKSIGVLATPHVFIFDKERKLRYIGAIDDSPEQSSVYRRHAHEAIEEMLAGKPVTVEKTRLSGCSTKWADKRESVTRKIAGLDALPVELAVIDTAALKKLAKNDGGPLLLINIWASTCQPCVDELHELLAIHRTYAHRGLRVVTISVDPPGLKEKAAAILVRNHMACSNYIASEHNPDRLAETIDPKWEGPTPYSILVDTDGKILYRKSGEIAPVELRKVIVEKLGRGN